MRKRIFISFFVALTLINVSVLLLTYARSRNQIKQSYIERYQAINQFLESVLVELEANTDIQTQNSMKLIREREAQGKLSNIELETLKNVLNFTDIYITDKNGHFIQTTDELMDEKLWNKEKSLFDFCADYKKMITGESDFEKTPILQSDPYRGPYKFLMMPNHSRTKIIEIGIHLDSISKTLLNMLNSDENFLSLGLYTPNGNQLEYIKRGGEFIRDKTKFINPVYEPISYEKDKTIFNQKITASMRNCCECNTKKLTLADNQNTYYYILRAEISNAPLIKEAKSLNFIFIGLFFTSLVISFFLSKFLSRFLIQRLENLENDVRKVIAEKDLSKRVQVSGNDEVTHLSKNMNHLLETLQVNQEILIETEKKQSLIQLAQQVAHDIKSPVSALNVLSQSLKNLEESKRLLFRNSLQRINDIANSLQSKGVEDSNKLQDIHLSLAIDQVVSEKRIEFKNNNTKINFKMDLEHYDIFVKVVPYEFKRIISNLINNSFEAIQSDAGSVEIKIFTKNNQAYIQVIDNGSGIPAHGLDKIFERGVTTKSEGSGIGLYHAKQKIEEWNGKISVESTLNVGTTLIIEFHKQPTPTWFIQKLDLSKIESIIIYDDDDSIHSIWKERIKNKKLVSYYKGSEFTDDIEINKSAKNLFLIDFEILNEAQTGLDIIEQYNLGSNSVLVTSRYDDKSVVDRAQKIGLKILPKPLAAFIPIT